MTPSYPFTEYAGWLLGQIASRLPPLDPAIAAAIPPSIERFGRFVYDLPASERRERTLGQSHHVGAFGLWEHSLEAAYWSQSLPLHHREIRGADIGAVALLVFYAALLHDVGKVRQLAVLDCADVRTLWDPDAETLADFAARTPRRRVEWNPSRGFVPDYVHAVGLVGGFVPEPVAARIREELPVGSVADLFIRRGDEQYPFEHRIGRLVRACDRNSQVDEQKGRSLRELAAFVERCRTAGAAVDRGRDGAPPTPLADPIARAVAGAVFCALAARRLAHAEASALVADFQATVRCSRYQLYRGNDRGSSLDLRWGSAYGRPGGRVAVRTHRDVDLRNVRRRGKIARHLPVYQAAEAARRRIVALGKGATAALRALRRKLAVYTADARPLPPAALDAIEGFTRRFGACRDLVALVAGAEAFAARTRADLTAAAAVVDPLRALLARRSLDGDLGRALEALRRLGPLALRFEPDPPDASALAPPRLCAGAVDVLAAAGSAASLGRFGLSCRAAAALARELRPLVRAARAVDARRALVGFTLDVAARFGPPPPAVGSDVDRPAAARVG